MAVLPPSGVFAPRPPDAPEPRFSGGYVFGVDTARAPMAFSTSPGGFSFAFGGPLAKYELVAMNPNLGELYGVDRGVFVVNVPEKSSLGLKAGDVVTAVDGRSVDTPTELIRVLYTYDAEKSFTLTVMRNKQRQSINTKLANASR